MFLNAKKITYDANTYMLCGEGTFISKKKIDRQQNVTVAEDK